MDFERLPFEEGGSAAAEKTLGRHGGVIGSLVAPGLVLGLGTGMLFNFLGIEAHWYTSAFGAQLSWTLPFGVLVMFAVMSRFDPAWEEAAYDLGANRPQIIWLIPILTPGIIAVALFGFTLSYDEFARTLQIAGSLNTLPLEIRSTTLNVIAIASRSESLCDTI
jgi:putative spermidine/putrescine transport system permease protein